MTARLGKGLREGSRAEPGRQRAEYAHFFLLKPLFSGRKKVPDASPGLFLGARFDFWGCFHDFCYILGGFWGWLSRDPAAGHPPEPRCCP